MIETLQERARQLRVHVLRMTHEGKASHVGSCFSMAEIITVLYGQILRVDPQNPQWPERDRFILSKGHASAALYASLAQHGFFPVEKLACFYKDGLGMPGHATHDKVPGVELSTGSLGHGLPVGTGMALAAKRDGAKHRIFVLLSDGECDEGSNWEAVLFAQHHKLDNLTAIIDFNHLQSLAEVKETLDLEPFADKWRACNWGVREIDGHDIGQLDAALGALPIEAGKPSCLIARTVKGKGVSFMEHKVLWHYRTAQGEEYARALAELGETP